MVVGFIVSVLLLFVVMGTVYRFHAVDLLPPAPPRPIPCEGCGKDHIPKHSFRFRVLRFLTLPTTGLLVLLTLPFPKTRNVLVLAEVSTVLLNRVALLRISAEEAARDYSKVGRELGFKEEMRL